MEKLCTDEVILSYVTLQGVDYLTFEVGEGSGGDFAKIYPARILLPAQKKKKNIHAR